MASIRSFTYGVEPRGTWTLMLSSILRMRYGPIWLLMFLTRHYGFYVMVHYVMVHCSMIWSIMLLLLNQYISWKSEYQWNGVGISKIVFIVGCIGASIFSCEALLDALVSSIDLYLWKFVSIHYGLIFFIGSIGLSLWNGCKDPLWI